MNAVNKLWHVPVILLGALFLYGTDLTSVSMFYGGLLPVLDILFLVYLTVLIVNCFATRGSALPPSYDESLSDVCYESNGEYSSIGNAGECMGNGDAGDCSGGGE
jgi:hypothetical protein